jgi:hypothetical protein
MTGAAHQGDIGIYVSALGVVTPLNTVSMKSHLQTKATYRSALDPSLFSVR